MQTNDVQLGSPQVLYKDTKANVEALSGIAEGAIAYATNTNEFGSYSGTAWTWGQGGAGGHTIQDEGSGLTARTNLNFVGEGVTATDDAGNDASIITIPGSSNLLSTFFNHFTPNTDPIDFLDTTITGYVLMGFWSSWNANSWHRATNAVYTVPVGKSFLTLLNFANNNSDSGSRKMRLYNVTDSMAFWTAAASPDPLMIFSPGWAGDGATPSKFGVIAAGKQVALEIWNADVTKRAMGVGLIAMVF